MAGHLGGAPSPATKENTEGEEAQQDGQDGRDTPALISDGPGSDGRTRCLRGHMTLGIVNSVLSWSSVTTVVSRAAMHHDVGCSQNRTSAHDRSSSVLRRGLYLTQDSVQESSPLWPPHRIDMALSFLPVLDVS